MIDKKYNKIIKAAKAGGKITKRYFGKVLEIEGKTIPADFRTKADLESEKTIIKILSKSFPEYNIFSEECGEINKNSDYTFHIDPLDGTNNFVLGVPYFSVSIGLTKGDEIIFGAVYNPVLDNMYYAQKGRGAFLNGKKIEVNNESKIENSSVSVVVAFSCPNGYEPAILAKLFEEDVKRVLTNWSVALDLSLLASGKIEAIVIRDIHLWDFIAGKIIAKEAGAMIADFNGILEKNEKTATFLISNGTKIHQEILEVLK
jgi:myo-inositol-1(or 4)-monophosphatase